jgi:5-methylcytosine-specific restriction endonuclease McrA
MYVESQRIENQFTKPKAKPGYKICGRCQKEKRLFFFSNCAARSDGLDNRCKQCKKEVREQPKIREYNKKKSREWRLANPERYRENIDRWNEENEEYRKTMQRSWVRNNRFRVRQTKAAYKIRRKKWESGGKVDYDVILMRDGFVCHICGNDVEPEDVSFDHVIPLSKGGRHSMDNVHVSHLRCNVKKNARLILNSEKVTPTIKAG